MGRPVMQRTGRLKGTLRRLWPDHNPLRRPVDRAEAALVAGLLAAFLVFAPLLALGAFHWASAAGHRTALRQRATAREVNAVLLQNAPPPVLGAMPASLTADVRARWAGPDGQVRTGVVPAIAGMRAGSSIPVWIGRAGQITNPPLMGSQVTAWAAQAAGGAPAVFAVLLGGVWVITRRSLNKRRLQAWETGWAAFGPRWTRHS